MQLFPTEFRSGSAVLTLLIGINGSFAQTLPTAHSLGSSNWTLTGWNNGVAASSYPGNGATGTDATTGVVAGAASANMVFWRTGTNDPGVGSTANADYTGAYNGSTGTRMNGEGANGFSFTNTGTSGNLGIAVVRLNSTGRENIQVSWKGRLLNTLTYNATTQNRFYNIRLQYYVGTTPASGTWTTVGTEFACNSSGTAYKSNGTVESFGPITLPVACENQANLYLRWQHYQASGSAGSRPVLAVDDIGVTSTATAGGSVTTGAVSTSPFCVTASSTASGTVAFTSSGTFTSNTYTAQLSDASGSFASPTSIGTLSSNANSGTVNITIPAGTAQGSGYLIRVNSSSPALTGGSSSAFTVNLGPSDITALTATPVNGSGTVSWTNPTSCFDDVLVVAHSSAVTGSPATSSYTANTAFGAGQAFPSGGNVVFQGTGSNVTVTGLTNGTTYHFKVFVRKGTAWSAGVATTVVPSTPQFAFTQIGTSGTGSGTPDHFEGITLKRIDLSSFSFTDNGICSNSLFRVNENTSLTPFASLTDVPAGTFVRLTTDAGTTDLDATDGVITKFASELTGLSGSGDQVILHSGTGNGASGCGGSGTNTYVAGINSGNSGWITTGTPTANNSYAPNTLADYHVGSQSDGRITGTISGTASSILSAAKAGANWTTANALQTVNLKDILFNESNASGGALAFSGVGIGSFTVNWSGVTFSGADANTRYVVVVHTSAPSNPVDRTTCFTANSNHASAPAVISGVSGQTASDLCGTPTTGNGRLVYFGYGTSMTVTGLSSATNYEVRVYAVNGNGYTANYSSVPASGNQTTTSSTGTSVSLLTTSGSVNEANGSHQILIAITNPSPSVPTSVQLALTSGSSVDVGGYTTQTVTFPAGSSANAIVTVPVTNDLIIEQNEVFSFTLQNPSGGIGAVLGSNTSYSLTIIDNDYPTLAINEVMYNSAGNDEEWIELYNYGSDPVDLSNSYTLECSAPAWSYAFPNTVVSAGGFLTVQVGTSGAFPFTPSLVRSVSANQLNNSAASISLKKGGVSFDEVSYSSASPWPTGANGNGPSLSLRHPQSDNTNPLYWRASCQNGGTPGAYNAVGTLRSFSSGNWPNSTTWQWKIEGTPNWTATPNTGFVITCQTDVTVRTSHTVTVPSGHVASADDVTVSGTLLVDNVATLNVGDKLSIIAPGVLNIPAAGGTATVNVGGDLDNTNGTLNIGNLNVVNITGDYITAYINTILGATAVMNVTDDWIFTGGSDNQPVMTNGTVNMMGTGGTQEIGTTTFYNLVMQGAAPKQVAAGAKVSVKNKLELQEGVLTTSAGQLILRSTATQTAFIDDFTDPTPGSLAGPIIMERYLPGGNNRYNYVGSAVQSPNIATELSEFQPYGTDGAQLLASVTCSSDSLFIGSPYGRLFEWRESASPGAYQPNCSTWRWHVRSTGTITSGMGLAALSPSGWGPITMSLSGIPHSGDVSTPALGLTGSNSWSGWHMVANPFPSAWTWNPTNAGAQGFNGQVQFFQATGPYVGQYIGSVGPQVIASSQGFFIKRTSGSGTFTFNQSGRTAAHPSFYSSVPWYESMFNLSLTGPNGADRTTFYLSDEATLGIDELWDADKLDGSTELPSLSSIVSEARLSVNSMPTLGSFEHRAITLNTRPAAAGVFSMGLEDMKGMPSEMRVVLEDKLEQKMYDLKLATYSFTSDGSDATDRFVLHLNPSDVQGASQASGIRTWSDGAGSVTIRNAAPTTMIMVEMTDMTGRVLLNRANMPLANGDTRIDVSDMVSGVYLLRITAADGTATTQKVVLR